MYAFAGDNSVNPNQANTGKPLNTKPVQDSLSIIRFGDTGGLSIVLATHKTEYLIDSLKNITLDKLLQKKSPAQQYSFSPAKNELPQNLGTTEAVWLRFTIQRDTSASLSNSAPKHSSTFSAKTEPNKQEQYYGVNPPFVLSFGNKNADSVELYITRANTVVYADTIGYSVPYKKWKLPSTQIAFLLPALCASGEVFTCYVRVRNSNIFLYSLRLVPREVFQLREYTFLQPLLLFYGIAVFALFYNFVVWVSTRSIHYGIYIAYVFCTSLFILVTSGHLHQLFSMDIPHFNNLVNDASRLMSILFGVLFVTAMIREGNIASPSRFWFWLASGSVAGTLLAFVLELLGLQKYSVNMPYYLTIFLALPSTLGMSFEAWRKGYRPALYLFIGRLFVEIGLGANSLAALGYVQFSSLWFGQFALIMPAVEMIFLGLALADRITFLQKTKQEAETKALEGELYRIKNVELSEASEEITRQQGILVEQSRDIQEMNSQVLILNDSLRWQNEKLVETNREKDELMGIVSHDLKNPIGAIRSYAELIQSGIFSGEEMQGAVGKIVDVSDRMLELVKNLLDLNQLESGGLHMDIVNFDILSVIEAVVDQYSEPASVKNITLHFSNDAEKNIVAADERYLMQVLDNIVSNAVKYSPHGKHVFVRVLKNNATVRVEVQDEGPGISEEDMKKLFGKFARLTAQPTGDEHSTGLGLSIVKKMVEAMNGTVWCESELGKGATFIVELPKSI